MFDYKVKILKVVDGDTVDVDIDLGFGIWKTNERVRIMGIDTPESRTKDKVEKKFGLAAKKRLKELLGKEAILKTHQGRAGEDARGKFGRVLGDFDIIDSNGVVIGSVAATLVMEGHAVPYTGGSKEDCIAQHLLNRDRLLAEGVVC
jgi:micrococcal nuclease